MSAFDSLHSNKASASVSSSQRFSVGHWASLACVLEATACKVGNVHRGADFEDVTFGDFLLSGWGIGPVLDDVAEKGIGETIYRAIETTRTLVGSNTNLGMILLLAPLAHAAKTSPDDFRKEVGLSLNRLTADDSRWVYRAINLAVPGGMGSSDEHDLSQEAPARLLDAMQLACDRDRIARQYVTEFEDVFDVIVPMLESEVASVGGLEPAIVLTHLRVMAQWPDSLIARKCGIQEAQQSQSRAQKVLDSGAAFTESWNQRLSDFDFWLRSAGHRRNPGTSADLVCAGLFVGFLTGRLSPNPWLPR